MENMELHNTIQIAENVQAMEEKEVETYWKYRNRPFLKAFCAFAFSENTFKEIATVQIYGSEYCNYVALSLRLPHEIEQRLACGRAAGSNYNRIDAAAQDALTKAGISVNVQTLGIEKALDLLMRKLGFDTFKVFEISK